MRTENCETVRNRCNVVSAVEVSCTLISYGLICSTSCSGFSIPLPRSLCSSWGKGSCEWQVCVLSFMGYLLPYLLWTKSHKRAGQIWLGRSVAPGRMLIEEHRGMGEEMASGPCDSTVSLWHPVLLSFLITLLESFKCMLVFFLRKYPSRESLTSVTPVAPVKVKTK